MLDRTSDLQLAAYLVANGYTLRGIEGPPGRRVFVFDREVPHDLLLLFHSSREKKALDAFRSLKFALMTTP